MCINGNRTFTFFSSCSFTVLGLVSLIDECRCAYYKLSLDTNDFSLEEVDYVGGRIVIVIPEEPRELFSSIGIAANIINQLPPSSDVLLLTMGSASWLWNTLRSLVVQREILPDINIARSNLPLFRLRKLLVDDFSISVDQQVNLERLLTGGYSTGMTCREYSVLSDMIQGRTISESARLTGRSIKTIYSTRQAGIKKIVKQHPSLAGKLPHRKRRDSSGNMSHTMSVHEYKINHAIDRNEIVPYFQPIVNGDSQLVGFEVLIRLKVLNRIISPNEFLPHIHSTYIWRKLTKKMIDHAIHYINFFCGELSLSVNIPRELCGSSGHLVSLIQSSCVKLFKRSWISCLIIEVAEDIDLNYFLCAQDVIKEIRSMGVNIYLDDCYSSSSVTFPVKRIRFDGFKLDMAIIDSAISDEHSQTLIKSLVYYASLSGGKCVAEGIDSREKFNLMKDMGVHGFQGYYFSKPVPETELENITKSLGFYQKNT